MEQKEKKKFPKWLIAIIVIVIIVAVAGTNADKDDSSNNDATSTSSSNSAENSTEQEEPEPTEEPIEYEKVKVDKLEKDLSKNALNAKELYDGKYLEITGKINVIDASGDYIALAPLNEEYTIISTIQCYVTEDNQVEKISKLSTGDKLTLKVKITDVGEVIKYSADIMELE